MTIHILFWRSRNIEARHISFSRTRRRCPSIEFYTWIWTCTYGKRTQKSRRFTFAFQNETIAFRTFFTSIQFAFHSLHSFLVHDFFARVFFPLKKKKTIFKRWLYEINLKVQNRYPCILTSGSVPWIFNSCSKLCNCSIKWKLGPTFDFLFLTRVKASFKLNFSLYIKYATVIVTERLTPAKQWTKTPFELFLPSSAH